MADAVIRVEYGVMGGSSDSEGGLTEEEAESRVDHATMGGFSESEEERAEEETELIREAQRQRQEHDEESANIASDSRLSFAEKLDRLREQRHWYIRNSGASIINS